MDIEQLPRTIEEIEHLIEKNDVISFVIREKNKYGFHHATRRLNRQEMLTQRHTSFFGKLFITPYLIYVGLRNSLVSFNDPGVKNALLVYMVAWRSIKRIDGEVLKNGMCRVFYYSRT